MSSNLRTYENLDLMRSFAVFLVIVDHTAYTLGHEKIGPWDTGYLGVFGVYLFFVHTCLVLMWSMERHPHTLSFYIRRAFRLYPLAIAAVLASLLFRIPVWAGGTGYQVLTFTGSTIAANLLLIQDLVQRRNIVGVMWTLTIEVQMYVVLPAFFYLVSRERKVWQLVVVWIFAVAEILNYVSTAGNIFPTVLPDFIPGVIAYLLFSTVKPRFPAWAFMPMLLALLSLYMYSPSPPHSWPLMLALAFLLPMFAQIQCRPLIVVTNKIAMYSYGIYLWHSFGMKLSFHFMPNEPGWVKVAAELLITAGASVGSYHALELPLMRYGNRLAARVSIARA